VPRDAGKAVCEERVFKTIAHITEIFSGDFMLVAHLGDWKQLILSGRFKSAAPGLL